jgi:membrane associated rhomboid family serine protease
MIIPWLKGFLSYERAPLTWLIIFLNIFIYLLIWDSEKNELDYFSTKREIAVLGQMYHQFKDPKSYRENMPSQDESIEWGQRAVRDPQFLAKQKHMNFAGDPVEIRGIQEQLVSYQEAMKNRWSFHLGLNNYSNKWMDWFTYQFMHASWIHVFGNMVMMLIFGAALETMIGSLFVAMIYLFSGCVGGFFFVAINGVSVIPMVGASASLSGIIAFYIFYEVKRRVAFMYFVSPFPGYYGRIYLPTLLLFPLIFLQDIVGFLNSDSLLSGGIAYTAHLGGAAAGIGLALVAKKVKTSIYFQYLKL